MIKVGLERILTQGRVWIEGYLKIKESGASVTSLSPDDDTVHIYAKDKAGTSALYWKNDADVESEFASAGSVVTDHGGLTGLGDDDHPQYRLESENHTHQSTGLQAGQLDHGAALIGLADDDHTQYALLAGRSGGQTLIGGTAASNNLTLQSTSNATKGSVVLSSVANVTIDEVTGRVGIGATPLEGSLQITQNQTEATNPQAGVQLLANMAPAANVNTPHYGLFAELRTNAAAVTYGNATGLVGVRGSVLFQGTGSVATLVGQKTIVDITNGGACSMAIGNHVIMQKGAGTIDHLFGVGVDSVVGLATNAWAFHSEGGTSRLKTGGASTKGLIIQAAASQSANLQEWQDSAAAVLFQFDASGFLKWVSGKEQTTVGAAGAASALPANPTKYLQVKDSAGTTLVIPAYAAA